jgi:hypothetical protein
MHFSSLLFWDVTQRSLVVGYRHFGTTSVLTSPRPGASLSSFFFHLNTPPPPRVPAETKRPINLIGSLTSVRTNQSSHRSLYIFTHPPVLRNLLGVFDLEDVTDVLSRNVGIDLPTDAT